MSYKAVSTVFPEVFFFKPVQQQAENGVLNFDRRAFYLATKTDFLFVQDDYSRSSQGALRRLHYQIQHPQGKLVQAIQCAVFDVTVDLRRTSPGFPNGFLVLSGSTDFMYKPNNYYAPVHERCLAWNDSAVGIDWPFSSDVVLSSKDAAGKSLANAECFE